MRDLPQPLDVLRLADVEDDVPGAGVDVLAQPRRALFRRARDAVAVDDVLGEVTGVALPQLLVQMALLADVCRKRHRGHDVIGELLAACGEPLGRDPERDPAVSERRRALDGRLRAAPDPERRASRLRGAGLDLDVLKEKNRPENVPPPENSARSARIASFVRAPRSRTATPTASKSFSPSPPTPTPRITRPPDT